MYIRDGTLRTMSSAWSNELCNNSECYLEPTHGCSELDKAAEYGLITNAVRGNMAAEITRENCGNCRKALRGMCGRAAEEGGNRFGHIQSVVLGAYNLGLDGGGKHV